jgi:hypothetical protein
MWMRACVLALLFAAAAPADPLYTHATGIPWTQIVETARHEVVLSVLVRELKLTSVQAKKLLDLLRRLDRTISGLVAAGGGHAADYRKALAAFRDRVLRSRDAVTAIGQAEFKARQAWDENAGQLEREVAPARDAVIAMLTPAQQKVVRAFSADRTLAAFGFDDYTIDEWTHRLVALRGVPEAEIDARIKDELLETLKEAGHPERLPRVVETVKKVRALPADAFEAELIAHARRLKALFAVGPEASASPAAPSDLNEAVTNHLLDMRMIPVLTSYLEGVAKADP